MGSAVHLQDVHELEGNVADDSGAGAPFDWASLFAANGTATATGPPIVASGFRNDTTAPDNTWYLPGGHEDRDDIPQWECFKRNSPSASDNVRNAYAAVYQNATGTIIATMGLERGGTGSTTTGFWFLQRPASCVGTSDDDEEGTPFTGSHVAGDVFVVSSFPSGMSTTVGNVSVYRWNTSSTDNLQLIGFGADCASAPPTDAACARVNNASASTPWGPGNTTPLATNTFIEAGVNLTGVTGGNVPCFVAFIAETRNNANTNGQGRDFAIANLTVCDARISIAPSNATNLVGTLHQLTATVERRLPGQPFTPVAGVQVNATRTGAGNFVGPATCITNATGSCTVNITSSAEGTTLVNASANVTVGSSLLSRTTNGQSGNSGPAQKNWTRIPTTTTTTPSKPAITLGENLTDAAVVLGTVLTPTGNVSFFVCSQGTVPCVSGGTFLGNKTLVAGAATSDPFTPNAAGTFCFRGNYSGDASHSPSADAGTGECFTVGKAASSTATTPSKANLVLGESLTDTAVVVGNSAAGTPTGSVDFHVCGPDAAACAAGGAFMGTVALAPNGTAISPPFTPGAAGSYCFRGNYTGDNNYNASADGGANECFEVARAPSTTLTQPAPAVIPLGASVTDLAQVGGGAGVNATGNVSFFACAVGVVPCAAGGTSVGNGTLDPSGNTSSPAFTPDAVGTWCFRAEYGGDAHYLPSLDASAGECFQVTKAASATATTPGNASIALGGSVVDHATVAGNLVGGTPTGIVSFFACAQGVVPCATGGNSSGIKALSGGNATSDPFQPPFPGTYCFRAEYGGDANYNASADDSTAECFEVTKANATVLTTPSNATLVLGENVSDAAVVTGNVVGGVPTGAVNFFVCAEGVVPCATGGDFVSGVALVAGAATSLNFTPPAPGTYCFRGEYAGDAHYLPAEDASTGECFDVGKAPSNLTTTPTSPAIVLGDSVADDATVEGNAFAGVPTGNVSFWVCGVNVEPCIAGGTHLGNVTLDGAGNATSPPFTPDAPGAWCFRGEYAGDANYSASIDATPGECFDVAKAPSTTLTTPSSSLVALGGSVTDSANVTGNPVGGVPAGSVEFFVCAQGVVPCTSGGTSLGALPLVGGNATSPPFQPQDPGVYCFRGNYSGGPNYLPSGDAGPGECFDVAKARPSVVTTPSPPSIVLGENVTDTAVVQGNAVSGVPTGNVSFYVCAAGVVPCTTGGAFLGNVSLVAGSATSPEFTPPSLGTFCFRGAYNGDARHLPGEDASLDECVLVASARSTTETLPSEATVQVGDSLQDLVIVSSIAGVPQGNVSFWVCAAGIVPCASGGSFVGNATLAGGMGASPSFVPTAPGITCFRGEYEGSTDHTASSDAGLNECFEVTKADSETASAPSSLAVVVGQSVRDNATVTGNSAGGVPTGNVSFYICNANVVPCATGGTFLGMVPLAGGNATSPPVNPALAATYCFRAEYSGDGTYLPSSDASEKECFTAEDDGACAGPAQVDARAEPSGIVVNWSSVPSATAYHVYRSNASGPFVLLEVVPAPGTMTEDSAVQVGTVYRYRVTAIVAGLETRACTTAEATAIPEMPTLLAVALAAAGGLAGYLWWRRR